MDIFELFKDAARLIGDRGKTYDANGTPGTSGSIEESFTRTAAIAALKLNKPVTPYEVAIVLESVKDARRAASPTHYDSHVDGINYRAFAAMFSGAEPPATVKVEAPRSREHDPRLPPKPPLSESLRAVDAAINGEFKS